MVKKIDLNDPGYAGEVVLAPVTDSNNKYCNNQIDIVICKENCYYGKESNYVKKGDYYGPKGDFQDLISVHKSCFKYPINVYTIATVTKEDEGINIKFIGTRPMELNQKQWCNFRYKIYEAIEELSNQQHYGEVD